jgi:hypothetical protein
MPVGGSARDPVLCVQYLVKRRAVLVPELQSPPVRSKTEEGTSVRCSNLSHCDARTFLIVMLVAF